MSKIKIFALFILLSSLVWSCSNPPPPPTGVEGSQETTPATTAAPVLTLPPTGVQSQEVLPSQTPLAGAPSAPLENAPSATGVQPLSSFRFVPQAGTPIGTVNFVRPEAGCNWMGVGGQVLDGYGKGATGLIVEVGGKLDNKDVLLLALTGGSTVLNPGGFEITLANQPIGSQTSLWVQLFDLSGVAQSPRVYFDTYAGEGSCEKNLVVVNFKEVNPPVVEKYIPFIIISSK